MGSLFVGDDEADANSPPAAPNGVEPGRGREGEVESRRARESEGKKSLPRPADIRMPGYVNGLRSTEEERRSQNFFFSPGVSRICE